MNRFDTIQLSSQQIGARRLRSVLSVPESTTESEATERDNSFKSQLLAERLNEAIRPS